VIKKVYVSKPSASKDFNIPKIIPTKKPCTVKKYTKFSPSIKLPQKDLKMFH